MPLVCSFEDPLPAPPPTITDILCTCSYRESATVCLELYSQCHSLQIWQGGGDGSDVAKIENIAVQCEKTFIKVEVKFDRPFAGMIYSKGHYSDQVKQL